MNKQELKALLDMHNYVVIQKAPGDSWDYHYGDLEKLAALLQDAFNLRFSAELISNMEHFDLTFEEKKNNE